MADSAQRGAARGERRTRSQRRLGDLGGDTEVYTAYFKERVYATFTGLAIALVVSGDGEHGEPQHAFLAVVLGVLGITIAGFVSDIVSHLAVEGGFPHGRDLRVIIRIAGGALGTVVTPGILLLLAWMDVLGLAGALRATVIVYLATLGIIGWMAVRRSRLAWWQQVVALALLVALGFGVVGLQTLAHSL
jgi:hypothetical protein